MITTTLANKYVDSAVRPVEKHDLGTSAIQTKRCSFEMKNKTKPFYTPSKAHMTRYNKKSERRGIIGEICAAD